MLSWIPKNVLPVDSLVDGDIICRAGAYLQVSEVLVDSTDTDYRQVVLLRLDDITAPEIFVDVRKDRYVMTFDHVCE